MKTAPIAFVLDGISYPVIAGGETPPAAPPAAPPATPPAAPPAAFDWKASGVDEVGQALVADRGWKNAGDLVTSYRNLEKLTGVPPEQLVRLPKDNTDPTAWRAVHTKMGCPEKADGYALPKREGDKDGAFEKLFAPWLHEAGVSKSAAHTVVGKWNAHLDAQIKAEQEQAVATQKQQAELLKSPGEWGDKFDANTAIVDRAAEAFGMTEAQLASLKASMGYAATMKFLYNIGSKVAGEGNGLIEGERGGTGFAGMSPESARAEIARLRADKTWAKQFNSADPKMKMEARDRMRRLEQMAYPGVQQL